MTRTGRTATLVAAATLFALAAPAALGADKDDDPVLEELRKMRERIDELEGWKSAREAEDSARAKDEDSELGKAIQGWLDEHGTESGVFGNVYAPRLRRLRFGGQLRMRFEKNRNSYTKADPQGDDTNDFVLNRARLNATMDINNDLDAFIEFQDARVWGSEPSTAANTGNTDLSEGWVRFKNIADENWTAKVGRQKIAISDQRFIGHLEWANSGRRFDGVTTEYQGEDFKIIGLATRYVEGGVEPASAGDPLVSGGDNDANLYGVWSFFPNVALDSTLELFTLVVDDGRDFTEEPHAPRTFSTGVGSTIFGTYGARFHGKEKDGPFDWDFQGALKRGDLAGDDLRAWAARGEVGYTLSDEDWKPRFSFQYNVATGEEKNNDGDHQQFQTLFPTNHGYYGISDYAAWTNTNSWAASVSVKPSAKMTVTASFWDFMLDERAGGWVTASGATARAGANFGVSRDLGQEFDVVLNYKTNEWLSWQFGWSHFWAGDFIDDTQSAESAEDTDFVYVQLMVGF